MHDLVDVHRNEFLVGTQARELLDAADRLRAVHGDRLQDLERAAHQVGVADVLLHELGVAEDGLEQIVEVVGDAAGELAERGQLLGLVELALDLSLHRDVAHDGDQAGDGALRIAQRRQRDGQRRGPSAAARYADLERVHGGAAGQAPLGVGIVRHRQQRRDGPAHGVRGAQPEDTLGRGIPAFHPVVTVHRDDRVTRGVDELFERALGGGDLRIEPRVTDGDGEVLGQHLEQLALAAIDRPARGAIVHHQVAERAARVTNGAHHDGRALGRRRAVDDADRVVVERAPELIGDGRRHLAQIELTHDRARHLAQDRELRDAQRLLGRLAPRRFLELARLGRQRAHLLDQARHLPAGALVGLTALHSPPNHLLKVLPRERLDQVLEGAMAEGQLDRLQRRVGRDHHDLDGGIDPLDAAQDLEAVDLRHLDVEDDQVGPELGQLIERAARAVGRLDLVVRLEDHAQRFTRAHLVVDDEDPGARPGRRDDAQDSTGVSEM